MSSSYNSNLENSQLGIRQYDWFEALCDSLDEDDRKEPDALAGS